MTDPCAHCDTRTTPLYRLPATISHAWGPVCWMGFIRLAPRAPRSSDRSRIPAMMGTDSPICTRAWAGHLIAHVITPTSITSALTVGCGAGTLARTHKRGRPT